MASVGLPVATAAVLVGGELIKGTKISFLDNRKYFSKAEERESPGTEARNGGPGTAGSSASSHRITVSAGEQSKVFSAGVHQSGCCHQLNLGCQASPRDFSLHPCPHTPHPFSSPPPPPPPQRMLMGQLPHRGSLWSGSGRTMTVAHLQQQTNCC